MVGLEVVGTVEVAFAKLSDLCEFLALTGIFPETYLAAPPLPGLDAGSRLAITVVERGTMVVSSS